MSKYLVNAKNFKEIILYASILWIVHREFKQWFPKNRLISQNTIALFTVNFTTFPTYALKSHFDCVKMHVLAATLFFKSLYTVGSV